MSNFKAKNKSLVLLNRSHH